LMRVAKRRRIGECAASIGRGREASVG